MTQDRKIRWLSDVRRKDVGEVGGKNASLGEMIRELKDAGVRVPEGFATTSNAYWSVIDANGLREFIAGALNKLRRDMSNLSIVGQEIRGAILGVTLPDSLTKQIVESYHRMAGPDDPLPSVAVRSSATAEDLPEASFAGQLETYLNVRGDQALLDAFKRCLASLFTDRAISYRTSHGFEHTAIALSVGVQRMVRSDLAGAGVMFSIDTETGFPESVLITAGWGLGETVVQGSSEPDEYQVFKPLLVDAGKCPIVHKSLGFKKTKLVCAEFDGTSSTKLIESTAEERASYVLSDEEVLQLARWACAIEDHYGQAMDMEWAKDGETGSLYIVQARPETVQSQRKTGAIQTFTIREKGLLLVQGLAIGDAGATGRVCRLSSPAEIDQFETDSILVTQMTDPDWVPIMKRAAGIITDHGGRTSHAAIVSREMGLPAVVGAQDATAKLKAGRTVSVSCCEGDRGNVYDGLAQFDVDYIDIEHLPQTRTKIMLNMANPAAAYRWWRLPSDGVGLARMEFIVGHHIKIHPMALVHFDAVTDPTARAQIDDLTRMFPRKADYFVENLARGIARLATAFYPAPTIVRLSDFKTNEYAQLIGGEVFEPRECNPMIGWRGASRYYRSGYRSGFELECRAIKMARNEIGLENIIVMIPFCRTLDEADQVLEVMAEHELQRGEDGLQVYMMVEIPANVILAEQFAKRFDGFSIGSNDLTQLILGVDRDSDILSGLFDEQNAAVKWAIAEVLEKARKCGVHTGLCGQAPSDHPEFARFLVSHGIDSISVSPDSFINVKRVVASAESQGS